MKKTLLRLAIFFMVLMLLPLIGCDVLYRSRIDISTCQNLSSSTAFAHSGVARSLLNEKGYTIRDQVTNDPFVIQELHGESFDVVWRADKPYQPTVIFARSNEHASVRLSELSGPLRPLPLSALENELYSVLASTCGQNNIQLIK